MQLLNERMLQDATSWLSAQRAGISDAYTKINRARRMTNTGRSLGLLGLLLSLTTMLGAVFLAFTSASKLLVWLPTYWPTQTLSQYALTVALLLLAALCLVNARRLYILLRDDNKAYQSLSRLKEIDRIMADHIFRASEITRSVDAQLQDGQLVSLFTNRSPEKDVQRLAALADNLTASVLRRSSGFVIVLYVANFLAWAAAASTLLMGKFLELITSSQQWYTWDTSALNLARWAFPASLLLLMILSYRWLSPENEVYTPARLLILIPLVPLAILLGWGVIVVLHFIGDVMIVIWEAIKYVFSLVF